MIPEPILRRCEIKANKDDAPGSIRVKNILPDDPMCEDCGKLCVTGRTVDHALIAVPETHWRAQCKACNNYFNPITLRYDINHSHQYTAIFREYLRNCDK